MYRSRNFSSSLKAPFSYIWRLTISASPSLTFGTLSFLRLTKISRNYSSKRFFCLISCSHIIRNLKYIQNLRLSLGIFWGCTESLHTLDEADPQAFNLAQLLDKGSNLASSFFSDNGNGVRTKFKENRDHVLENGLRGIYFQQLSQLLANALSDSPFLLVLLEFLKYPDKALSFLRAQYLHNLCQMLDDSQFNLII